MAVREKPPGRGGARAIAASIAAFGALALIGCYGHVVTTPYVPPPPPPGPTAVVVYDDEDPACLATFEPALAPYGTWVEDETHGLIWIPSPSIVGAGYRPYVAGGHWAYSSEGYVFVSEHPWGWVTYHYGRWVYSSTHGWVWVPGARYAPSWVTWRYGGGYIGWAPQRPTWRWHMRVAYTAAMPPPPPFVFVQATAFFSPHLTVFLAPPSMHPTLFKTTTRWIAPSTQTFRGPPPKVAGIPQAQVVYATVAPPHAVRSVPFGKPLVIPPAEAAPIMKPLPPIVNPLPPIVNPLPPPILKPPPIKKPPKPGIVKPLSIQ